MPRVTRPPTTSRRWFCLPYTLVDHAHFGPEGNGPEPFVSNRYSMESSSSVVTVYPTRLLRPLIQMLRDKLEESRGALLKPPRASTP